MEGKWFRDSCSWNLSKHQIARNKHNDEELELLANIILSGPSGSKSSFSVVSPNIQYCLKNC